MAIEYTDGESVENRVKAILTEAQNLGSAEFIGYDSYAEWGVRYHLCPERANLVRPFHFEGLSVLEIGAGMGAVSRFLAEHAKALHIVEGTEARFDGIKLRLRDLNNWTGEVAEFASLSPQQNYDVVVVIGVLEYAERFMSDRAHQTFLEQARKHLKPNGTLILAIENAMGIKYWGGAAEDHTGNIFDGILGYSATPKARTFSKSTLTTLLKDSGFQQLKFYYPFPDYKIPSCLITDELIINEPQTAASLACHRPYENYCTPRVRYFPDSLSTLSIAESGLLSELSNSFLVLASPDSDSATFKTLMRNPDQIGWHFGNSPTQFEVADGKINVRKGELISPLIKGAPLRFALARLAYFGDWKLYLDQIEHFLLWSLNYYRFNDGLLNPNTLDAVFLNAIRQGNTYQLFDLEWSHTEPIKDHWFIFRNVFGTIRDIELFNDTAPFRHLRELYTILCQRLHLDSDFDEAMQLETVFQHSVNYRLTETHHREELIKLFLTPFPSPRFPRSPALEAENTLRMERFERENARFRAFASKRPVRAARKAMQLLKRFTKPVLHDH